MKKRLISAFVALLIVIPLIILGGTWFYIGAGLIGLIGFNELLSAREKSKKFPIPVKLLAVLSFTIVMMSNISSSNEFIIDFRYIVIPFVLCLIPMIPYYKNDRYNIEDALFIIGSVFFIGVSFNFLISIRSMDLYYFLYLIIITILSDTFAHFFGTQIGKHKMSPKISPNKTIEGLIGGTIFSTFVGTVFFVTIFEYTGSVIVIVLISLLLSIMSAFGDLIFSAIKRHFNIKDFGNIMPGHGGVLDRTDSIIFAALAFALVISFL